MNEGIELIVHNSNDLTVPIGGIPMRYAPTVLDELNREGGCGFKLPADQIPLMDDGTVLDEGKVIRVRVGGQDVNLWEIQKISTELVGDGDRSAEYRSFSGPSLYEWLSHGIVLPEAGIAAVSDDRAFNYAAKQGSWYVASDWKNAVSNGTITTGAALMGTPKSWPKGLSASWIWDRNVNPTAPAGDVYFRREFTTSSKTDFKLIGTADDFAVVLIDGQQVMAITEFGARGKTFSTNLTLPSGNHVLAVKARNVAPSGGRNNPAGFILAMVTGDKQVEDMTNADRFLWTGDTLSAWKVNGYPVRPPGFTIGGLLTVLRNEAVARGVDTLGQISLGFTQLVDSYGVPWQNTVDLSFKVGSTLLEVVKQITDTYSDVWLDPGLVLHAAPARGVDRSFPVGGKDPVAFQKARNVTAASVDSTAEISNTLFMKTSSGIKENAGPAASKSKYGRRETFISAVTASTDGTAPYLVGQVFDKFAFPRRTPTIDILATDEQVPFRDFMVGDWVLAPSDDDANQLTRRRVVSISVGEDGENGQPEYTVEIDTIQVTMEERLARWLQENGNSSKSGGVSGTSSLGQSSGEIPAVGGNSGDRPLPIPPDSRRPNPPTALQLSSDVVSDTRGYKVGNVSFQWTHDGKATDGTQLEIKLYNIYYRPSGLGAFKILTSTPAMSGGFGPLPITTVGGAIAKYEMYVDAEAITGTTSFASTTVEVVMTKDVEPPIAPQPPLVSCERAVFTVKATDKDVNGAAMANDLSHYVMEHSLDGVAWTEGQTFLPGMFAITADLPYGTVYFRLLAIDYAGNESEPSGQTISESFPLVDEDSIRAELDNAFESIGLIDGKADAAKADAAAANTAAGEAQAAADAALERSKDVERLLTNKIVDSGLEEPDAYWHYQSVTFQDSGQVALGKFAILGPDDGFIFNKAEMGPIPGLLPMGASIRVIPSPGEIWRLTALGYFFKEQAELVLVAYTAGAVVVAEIAVPMGDTVSLELAVPETAVYLSAGIRFANLVYGNKPQLVSLSLVNVTEMKAIDAAAKAAQDAADAAADKAQDALEKAGLAQDSADGKNNVYYEEPLGTSGLVKGDTWFDDENGLIKVWSGTEWVEPQLGAGAVKDLAITNAKILNLDGGKITAETITGIQVKTGSLFADKVVIGTAGNMLPDPGIADTAGWYLSPGASIQPIGTGKYGGRSILVGASTSQVGTYYGLGDPKRQMPVTGGSAYRGSMWVKSATALAPFSISMYIRTLKIDGTTLTNWVWKHEEAIPANTWTQVQYMREFNDDAKFIIMGAFVEPIANVPVTFSDFTFQSATGQVLLMDGAVIADKIATNAVIASKIAALSVQTAKLAANAVTADKANIGSLRAGILTADSIIGSMIQGQAIDGMVITGAVLRTAVSGRRTQISSAGLTMWDGSNAVVLSQNATTGDILMRGNLSSRSFGGNQLWAGADMRDSGATGAVARAGIVFKSDAAEYSAAAVYRDGTWGAVMIDSPYSSTGTYVGQSTISVSNHGIEMWASKAGALTGPTVNNSMMLALNADGTWWIGGGGTRNMADGRIYWQSGSLKVRRNIGHMLDFRTDRSTVLTTSKLDVTGSFYAVSKNFKIRHPSKEGMDLYHGSTESPVSGIEYWGEGEVGAEGAVWVDLPDYYEALAKLEGRAAFAQAIEIPGPVTPSRVVGGRFKVTGTPGQPFVWHVLSERFGADFEIEQPTDLPEEEESTEWITE